MLGPKSDRSAVSEIVGALMLVLIVVIAASSFAVFLSNYQQSAQAQQLDDQKRTQENIKVLSIEPVASPNSSNWYSLNFTIASLHNEESEITRILINDNAVWQYDVWRQNLYVGGWEKDEFGALDRLTLGPGEELHIYVGVGNGTALDDNSMVLTKTGYVKIDIITEFGNEFSKSFLPPSAVASHSEGSQWNALKASYDRFVTLNGRSSVANGGASIVSWNWTVVSSNATENRTFESTGSVCRFDYPLENATNEVTLVVTDNYGMDGYCSYKFYN